jgi:hypothetical protein
VCDCDKVLGETTVPGEMYEPAAFGHGRSPRSSCRSAAAVVRAERAAALRGALYPLPSGAILALRSEGLTASGWPEGDYLEAL